MAQVMEKSMSSTTRRSSTALLIFLWSLVCPVTELWGQGLRPARATTTLVTNRAPFSHSLPSHGRFLVVRDDGWLIDTWQDRSSGLAAGEVFVRATTSVGQQLPAVRVTRATTRFFSNQSDLATDGRRVAVVWDAYRDGFEANGSREGIAVFLRMFDRELAPLSPVIQVSGQSPPARAFPSVAADGQSVVVVFSADTSAGLGGTQPGGVWARRYDWTGQPIGSPFRLDEPTLPHGGADFPTAAMLPDGGLVVGWTDFTHDQVGDAVTRVVDPGNELASPSRFHHFPDTLNVSQELEDLVVLPSGASVILGLDRGAKFSNDEPLPAAAFASVRSASQMQVTVPFGLSTLPAPHDETTLSAVAVGEDFFAAWTSQCFAEPSSCEEAGGSSGLRVVGRQFDLFGRPMTEVLPLVDSPDDHFLHALSAPPQLDIARSLRTPTAVMTYESAGTVVARRLSAPCQANAAACLLFERFAVHLIWSLDPGFEDPSLEISPDLGINLGISREQGNSWASFSLFDPNETDVIVKILDATNLTGSFWVFVASLTDVAFEIRVLDTVTGLSQTYANPRGVLASLGDTVGLPNIDESDNVEVAIASRSSSGAARLPVDETNTSRIEATPGTGGLCAETSERLCFFDRFQAEVTWSDFEGGVGRGMRFATESSKAFWFFDPDVPELAIKILDGTPINGSYWVYLASLTNVAFELRITDLVTGREQLWTNEAGEFASFGDVTAFPVTP